MRTPLDQEEVAWRVSDLKQWVYCPRILYYHHCLPDIRPTTYKMAAGIEAGRAEEGREERRSLRAYGLTEGEREYNVRVRSVALGLRGEIDMLITCRSELIPVDYKLSNLAGPHFKLQLAAYAAMLEDMHDVTVRRGFLYFIPLRRAVEVPIDKRLRQQLTTAVAGMLQILEREEMPAPTPHRRKCLACEFRRFCNDVL